MRVNDSGEIMTFTLALGTGSKISAHTTMVK